MNDIIKPMGFDLTKNLHGHVRVETRSRWTGKVIDSQEKDNLVTNAAQKMLQIMQWSGSQVPNAYWTPIYSRLLGGIMLFDNTLTESANNISFPPSAKLVGFAGQGSDSGNVMCGSRNSAESVFSSNGFTTVWDFLTSQANGTIASIARTSYMNKYNPCFGYEYASYSWNNSQNGIAPAVTALGYDETNGYLYLACTSASTVDGISFNTSTIYRAKLNIEKIGLIIPPLRASRMEPLKTLTSADGTIYAYSWVYDKFADNFVYITNSTIHLIANDGTHSTKTATGVSGSHFAVTETYYWVANGTTLYRITKSNTSEIETYSVRGQNLSPSKGDVLYAWADGFGNTSIVYPDGTVVTVPADSISTGNAWSTVDYKDIGTLYSARSGTAGSMLFARSNYLGTIANLDSPVTKTSSQTMKITYTLTEA